MNTDRSFRAVTIGLMLGLLAASSASGQTDSLSALRIGSQSAPSAPAPGLPAGEQRVRLGDGRQLILSADGTTLTIRKAGIRDAVRIHPLPESRLAATMTAMPHGRVLIWGGADGRGRKQAGGLWFDPELGTLEPTQELAMGARAGHTVTVLTDGRVLFVGGQGTEQSAELWDERSNQIVDLKNAAPRLAGHRAELRPDGRVRLFGGMGRSEVLFDPSTRRFIGANERTSVAARAGLAGSLPMQGAQEVSPEARLAVRFTEPMRLADLQLTNVTLIGPGGAAAVQVVPAEEGRLLFVHPLQALFPDSKYTLLVDGVHTRSGTTTSLITLDFKTAALTAEPADNDLSERPALASPADQDGRDAPRQSPDLGGCGQAAGTAASCKPMATLQDGIWTPGRSNTQGRWRIAEPQPELMNNAIMSRVTAAVGFTTLIGQIRRVDGVPVANVEVSVGGLMARTDGSGHFTLHNAPAGRQEVYVDGTTANGPGIEYGQFVIGVEIGAGKLTQLPYTMYLPRITERDKLRIDSPLKRDVVMTHPDMPGLMVQIPAGTVIRDRRGRIVRELAIVPTPVNRAPFPVAQNYPMYFTLEPGGAVIQGLTPEAAKGVRVFYPNYDGYPKGTQANFWIYDPADGWRVYGKGRVTSNGRVFAPEAGVALHQTMGGSYSIDEQDEASEEERPDCNEGCGQAQSGSGGSTGDPIDLRTGRFFYEETDIVIPDVVPIRVGRAYRQIDILKRGFGIATSLNYDYKLTALSEETYDYLRLVLPSGIPIVFSRVSGSGLYGEWRQMGSVTSFNSAVITFVSGAGFRLRFPDGSVMHFSHYSPNPLQWMADRHGNRTEFTYDAGLLVRVTSPSGRFVTFEHDTENRIKHARTMAGQTWSYEYDASNGLLSKVIYPDQTFKRYTYRHVLLADTACPPGAYQSQCRYYNKQLLKGRDLYQHAVESVIDRRGIRILKNEFEPMIYDWIGRINKQILADGSFYAIDYLHAEPDGTGGYGTLVTHPDGSQRRLTFESGHKFPASDTIGYGTPLAQKVRFERNAYGQVTARIDPLDRRTEYSYNDRGQTTQVTYLAGTPEAVTMSMAYDADHQLTSLTDPLGRTTQLEYANGCLIALVNPLGKRTTLACNIAGQPTSVTDPLHRTTFLQYLHYDLAEVVDPLGRRLLFRHDAMGRVIAVEDAEGNLSRREYDAEGRVNKLIDPSGKVTELGYDPNGNVTAVLMPHGNGITWTYDNRDRVQTRTDSLGRTESWTYTHMDQVKTYTDRKAQTTSFAYDVLGRLTTTTYPDGSTVTAGFDAGNRLRSLVDTASGSLGWDYDGLDRLVEAVTAQGSIGYEYDKAGRRTAMTAASQPRQEYQYDANDRLLRMLQGTDVVDYAYDDADRLLETVLPNGIKTGYAYNDANQVTGIAWLKPDSTLLGDLGYGYNAVGRRVAQTGSFATTPLPAASSGNSFDDNNRQTSHKGQALSYDANGNLTFDGTRTYVWNARDQLVQIRLGASTIASFGYDALGRRTTRTEGGQTTAYLYDGLDAVQEKTGSTVNPILTGLGIDERYARNDSGGRAYFLTDALGSTRALTNASGNVVNRYDYTPYGQTTQTASGFSNPYQYTGRERDANGMYYYRARYYSAGMGRFVSEDPIGLAGGDLNVYAYVYGDPLSTTDPSGEFGVVGAAFGAGLDLALQLAANGGNLGCVNWLQVGVSGALGAVGGGALGGAFRHAKSSRSWFDMSHKWKNVGPRVRNAQGTSRGNELHHWLIERNSPIGRKVPDWIKNHPWNLNPVSETAHIALHRMDPISRTVAGAPGWAQAAGASAGAGAAAKAAGGGCGCN